LALLAAERLAALHLAALACSEQTASDYLANLETISAAQEEVRRWQALERQTWQEGFAALRNELKRERSAQRSAEEQSILLHATLEHVLAQPDPDRQSIAQAAGGS